MTPEREGLMAAAQAASRSSGLSSVSRTGSSSSISTSSGGARVLREKRNGIIGAPIRLILAVWRAKKLVDQRP
jgi:hypothetical protein